MALIQPKCTGHLVCQAPCTGETAVREGGQHPGDEKYRWGIILGDHRAKGLLLARGPRDGFWELGFKIYTFKGTHCFRVVCLEGERFTPNDPPTTVTKNVWQMSISSEGRVLCLLL